MQPCRLITVSYGRPAVLLAVEPTLTGWGADKLLLGTMNMIMALIIELAPMERRYVNTPPLGILSIYCLTLWYGFGCLRS